MSNRQNGCTPTYRVLEEQCPDHDKQYRVGVFIGRDKVGEGKGSNKKEAEGDAATAALRERYGIDPDR
ncbi:MAG: hypothetical protein HY984_00680 [Candidatus Magasanikbacteria bacterium]|nr:hypothetical protein [Candidatus Magasanikbacteria bacterium]